MDKKFTIYLFDEDNNNQKITFSGEFTDDEWEVLENFMKEARKLFDSEIFPSKLKVNIGINWDEKVGFTDNSSLPSDDAISILLHKIRPFILQKENTYIPKVCNTLRKRISNSRVVEWINEDRDQFLGKHFESHMRIVYGNRTDPNIKRTQINSEETLQKWLNAYEYHRDENKKIEFENLNRFFPYQTNKAIFICMLIDKVRALTRLYNIIYNIKKGQH
ncbi:MAG: hypothetical protein AB7V12_07040 [Candidatus Dadabacteria bacterium]